MSEQKLKSPMPVSLEPDPVLEVYKKDVDRTLLQENLKLTVEERFRNLMQLQRFAEEMRQAGRRAFRDDRTRGPALDPQQS